MEVKLNLPLLPLRDIVVFPSMVIPLFVGRDKSITALNEVMKKDKKIILVTQKNSEVDDPSKNDVFPYACESSILQLLKLPDGTVKVLIEGLKRVKILDFKDEDKFISCTYEHKNDVTEKEEDLLIYIGDYIDRGPKSKQVIDQILQLKNKEIKTVFLMGNHEEMMINFLFNKINNLENWLINGADKTFKSYDIEVVEFIKDGFEDNIIDKLRKVLIE